MKDFIKRIKNDYECEIAYKKEPIYFKAFLWFAVLGYGIVVFLFGAVCFVTVPIWIIPYFIWWRNKELGKVVKREHYKTKKKLKEDNENLKNQIEQCVKDYNVLSEKYESLKGLVEDTNNEEVQNVEN